MERKDTIGRGQFLTGGSCPVDEARPPRLRVQKGMYLTADGGRASFARPDEPTFEHGHAGAITEIARRLDAVREGLKKVRGGK
jgi:hypothetical protein